MWFFLLYLLDFFAVNSWFIHKSLFSLFANFFANCTLRSLFRLCHRRHRHGRTLRLRRKAHRRKKKGSSHGDDPYAPIWDSEPMRGVLFRNKPSSSTPTQREAKSASRGSSSGSSSKKKKRSSHGDDLFFFWGEIWDSNPRPSGPQPDALTNCANPTIWRALRDSNPRPTA